MFLLASPASTMCIGKRFVSWTQFCFVRPDSLVFCVSCGERWTGSFDGNHPSRSDSSDSSIEDIIIAKRQM